MHVIYPQRFTCLFVFAGHFSTSHLHSLASRFLRQPLTQLRSRPSYFELSQFSSFFSQNGHLLSTSPDVRNKWLPHSSTLCNLKPSRDALEISSSQTLHHQLCCYLSVFNLSICTHSTLPTKCFLVLKSPTLNPESLLHAVLSLSPFLSSVSTICTCYLHFLSTGSIMTCSQLLQFNRNNCFPSPTVTFEMPIKIAVSL